VFLIVVARAALAPKSDMKRDARLALDDGAVVTKSQNASEGS
jgi:hypothetical protein